MTVVEYVDSCGIYFITSVKCNFFCVCLKMCCVLFKVLGQKYYHCDIMYTVCLPWAASYLDSNTGCTRNAKLFDLEVNVVSVSYNTGRCDKYGNKTGCVDIRCMTQMPKKKNYFMSSFCTYRLVNSLLDIVIVHSTTAENGTLWYPILVYLKINPVPEMLALSDFM
jgi:hypothetical protein